MGLLLAFKAFFKALKDPEAAQLFLDSKTQGVPVNITSSDTSHLRLIEVLQRTGRLVDFLQEEIDNFDDAQVGAAAREVHRECRKSLEELLTLRPILQENEGATIHIPKGYDPSKIKITGSVIGEPPYTGVVIHRGWVAHKQSLPKQVQIESSGVVCPAEVEAR